MNGILIKTIPRSLDGIQFLHDCWHTTCIR